MCVCTRPVPQVGKIISNTACADKHGPAPPASQECNTGVLCAYWKYHGTWGECSVSCGAETGMETRTQMCTYTDGSLALDSACDGLGASENRECNADVLCADWQYTWDGCSVTCGFGMETQTHMCTYTDAAPAPDSACDGPPEIESRVCYAGAPCNPSKCECPSHCFENAVLKVTFKLKGPVTLGQRGITYIVVYTTNILSGCEITSQAENVSLT